ncbi:MAG: (d)CMP kinase [Calditerrivibrio sp.]|nr:(d)CMP kinase [Calditerrivibrio sp.]MCA1932274.1 (d)CMP kinase [Calditerrivibrio sp.]
MLRIAIDGPAGSGKSTVAKKISKILNLTYVDTGAMYRSCAWVSARLEINGNPLVDKLKDVDIQLKNDSVCIIINGELFDITEEIRTPEITKLTGEIASDPSIRKILLEKQKIIAQSTPVVMDGRDIGTVVIPDAEVKIFLTANPEERAKRRYEEMVAKGINTKFEDVYNEILDRDFKDSSRDLAPLKKAEDSVEIDTTSLSIDEVVTKIIDIVKAKGY